jgi:FHA domain
MSDLISCEILHTNSGDVFHVSRFGLLIGQVGGPSVLQVKGEGVTKRHARIVYRDGRWFAEAINENDRIKVNGKSCRSDALVVGSAIKIGDGELKVNALSVPTAPVAIVRHRKIYPSMVLVHILRFVRRLLGRLERMLTPPPLR